VNWELKSCYLALLHWKKLKSEIDMTSVTMRVVESAEDFENALAVRLRVFVQEQSVPIEEEVDNQDNEAVHAIAELEGLVVATGRLILQEFPIVYIGRMAVDIEHRRHGIGGGLLIFLEDHARNIGAGKVILHAQEYVKSFYVSHGYEEQGAVFMEANIPHVLMSKDL
jgi:predicted GNAT family N-acyltransferase